MIHLIGLFAAIALSLPSIAAAETGFLNRSVQFKASSYRYQVFVPADYTPTKSWPVVLYLHGNGRQGIDGLRQTNGGFANNVRQNPSFFPAIIVFAQAQPNTQWRYPEMEELAMAELEQTAAEFATDATRTYLIGYSMGAAGAYRVLYRWPERFSAAVAVAGRVEPSAQVPANEIAIDRKTHAYLNAGNPFAALADAIKAVPVWIFHGDVDEQVPVEQSRRLAPALQRAGADVRYTEMPGVHHNEAPEVVFAKEDPMAWLLAQRRKAGTN